ncbi:uncharacterized protein LOC100209326 isoform X2 [Hydra vulgaris]|uniref:Uncharacterized protein LOC100209326 isoform X2 n=1 Tax=Hydra vulgaris TaxID=6087 RepID=A0ABM4BR24_HYDVU
MTAFEMNKNGFGVTYAIVRYSSTSDLEKCSEDTVCVRKFSDASNHKMLHDHERKDFNFKLGKYQKLLEKEHDLRMRLNSDAGDGISYINRRRATATSDTSYSRCLCGRKIYSLVNGNQAGCTEDKTSNVRTSNPRRCHHMSLNDECQFRETDRKTYVRKERPASMCEIDNSLRILEAREKADNRKQKLHMLEQDCIKASKLISKSNSNLNQIA